MRFVISLWLSRGNMAMDWNISDLRWHGKQAHKSWFPG